MIKKSKYIAVVLFSTLCTIFFSSFAVAVNTSSSYFNGYTSLRKHNTCGGATSFTYERVLCDGVNDSAVLDGGNFSKDKFVNYVLATLYSGNLHKKVGASFIIHTMIGKSSPDYSVDPTADEISDWKSRIFNSNVEVVSVNKYYNVNSGYVESSSGSPDIKFYTDTGTAPSWIFRNNTTKEEYYVLKKSCANPVGSLNGLPNSWSAEPGVGLYVNGNLQYRLDSKSGDRSTEINVGDLVGWRNLVTFNNGSSSVQYSAEKGGSWGGSIYGGSTTTNVDRALLSEELGGKDKLIEPSDAGKTFCLWTHIDPSSQGGPSAASSKACVYVKPNWNISATSSVNKTVAAPGDRITWTHNLINDGPSNTTDRVYSRLEIKGIPEWPSGTDMAGAYTEGGQGVGIIRNITDYSIYDVQQRDVGNKLCEQIQYQRIDNGAYGSGNEACVDIPYSYTLTPVVSINPGNVVEDGSSFTVTPTIKNNGATKSKPSNWNLVEVITYPSGAVKSTTTVGSGNGVTFDQNSTKTVITLTPTASGEAGTKYCYILSASPRSGDDDSVVSAQACITIGKKPKVQITGGNLSAGGLVNTSTSIKNSRMFGSWTEYGVFAVGSISGMASGSAFASPAGLSGYSVCGYSTLSFTNVKTGATSCSGNAGTIGNYVGANTATSVASSFPGGNAIPDNSVSADSLVLGSGTYIGNKTGDLTLSASTLAAGKSVILKVNGTVTITGDQFYENKTYTNASELPQLIIIANNINITDNVANIDAWLVANSGNINTCSNFSGNLTVNKCSKKLIINGPVSAKKLLLYRTAGSGVGVNSGDPAEIFNLRADAYLWSAAYAKANNKIQSVYTTELPPRF